MDGGRVRERKLVRNIELEYSYDRLIDMKMIQAYQLSDIMIDSRTE